MAVVWDPVTRDHVVRALQEYDRLGPEKFFSRAGVRAVRCWDAGSRHATAANERFPVPRNVLTGCYGTLGSYAGIVRPDELAKLARLRRARDLMDREYATPLDVASIARVAWMSPAHFQRQFRAAYGETPYGYLMTRRIERAKALLRRGDLSVTEVCMAVGCTSLGSFSARFTQLVGETPTAYRSRDHGTLAGVPGCVAKDITRPSHGPSKMG